MGMWLVEKLRSGKKWDDLIQARDSHVTPIRTQITSPPKIYQIEEERKHRRVHQLCGLKKKKTGSGQVLQVGN